MFRGVDFILESQTVIGKNIYIYIYIYIYMEVEVRFNSFHELGVGLLSGTSHRTR